MSIDSESPDAADALADVEFVQLDAKGEYFRVHWRKLPIGSIRRLTRMPKPPRHASDEVKQRLREEYKAFRGKWVDPYGRVNRPVETKEEGARQLLARFLADTGGHDRPLEQAALRGDTAEVERLMAELSRPS